MPRFAIRAAAFALALALAVAAAAADATELRRYDRVEIAPTRTSIYIGTVAMTMPPFTRANGAYESTYAAKVFPFFFQSETGRLRVDISDAMLGRLERGERVAFTGQAIATHGDERRVEGHATPAEPGAPHGTIKVRVFVSKRIELIFNTTYRFPEAAAPEK
ncbi:MAG: hypothetical protein Q8N18_11695 [Opitutaceae bacterium]|nr:hypothetical protein [Opitutaceae bacterium]